MKSEVRFLHKFLKSIGFSEYTTTRKIQELVKDVIMNPESRNYTTLNGNEDTVLVEFCKNFAENMGIAVCGEESYAGVCDDIKVGVTLIFYLQNMIPYIKYRNTDKLPVRGTSLTLSALGIQGSIMMPIIKSENQKKKIQQSTLTRNQLIEAARRGDEDAIESLTLEDMDTYTTISRRIQKEDVFSLVDTYFMPYGVECDQYSVLGEITECHIVKNRLTEEEICVMTLNCNELSFDVCINVKDLFGEPKVGRRFKGVVWLQGAVNYPEQD